ncbi:MAG TPA: LacI family DNA-binding transcriptional regulator [Solirubrobacteraceae bacterium]|nr:LacI family DNA-binding transcriptional regulator [Solirubrobacteraceae bacterium]
MARRPTIRDVAARAGVHPATASRALNPALPGRIAEATAARVRAAARDLGYTPDPAARSLRTRRSGVVGVVVPDLTNPVLPPIVRGVEETLWPAGLACLVADTDNDPEREASAVAELAARRCDGLIVASATRDSATVRALATGDVATVLVTRDVPGAGLSFVGGDDAAGVRAAVRHVAELGHERIGYVAGPADLSTTRTRLDALHAAVAAAPACARPVVRHARAYTVAAGRAAARRLLAADGAVSAILAGNDMLALGVYEALADAGLRCPAEISVVGHNDMPMVDKLEPPLTTVAIPQYEIGIAAARLLMDRLGRDRPAERRLLPTRLVVRRSTAPPPVTARAGLSR